MDQLKALAKLVNDSVAEIEKSCIARNVIFPSLSEPFTPESEAARADHAVIEAAGIITAAASQLIALVRPAPLTLFMRSIQVSSANLVVLYLPMTRVHIPKAANDSLHSSTSLPLSLSLWRHMSPKYFGSQAREDCT